MLQANSLHSTVVVPINDGDGASSPKKNKSSLHLLQKISAESNRKFIHSIKVGISLVLVSLFYLVDRFYDQYRENWVWAAMTVVLVFELRAGATLSKALNRGLGTIIGGGLGCLAALLSLHIDGFGRAIAVGTSVFISGAAASYSRFVPNFKKRYDYGAMIFILTFTMVMVSGFRGEEPIKLASDRLSTIAVGLSICVFTSLVICPVWAGDELHRSLVSKFNNLALSIQEILEEYFKVHQDQKKETRASTNGNGYISVLHSKSADVTLANFAKWEPWHGKFGFSYPWNKYIKIGNLLIELATMIHSLKGCLQSCQQSTMSLRLSIKDPCEEVGTLLSETLRELGDEISNMRRGQQHELFVSIVQSMRIEPRLSGFPSKLVTLANENGNITDGLSVATFVFMLMEIVHKVEELAKEVQELGDLAGFASQ